MAAKFTKLLMLFLLYTVLVGCSKYEFTSKSIKDKSVIFMGTTENFSHEVQTKTYLDDNKKILWHEKDELTIFGSTLNEKFQFNGETGDNSGTFSKIDTGDYGSGNPIERNYAIYPYDKKNKIENDESYLTIPFPALQYYMEGSIGRGANVAIAVTNDLEDKFLSFKNACSYFCVSMYASISEDNISTVELEGRNGEKIAGTGRVIISDSKLPVTTILEDSDVSGSIIIDCGESGVKIGTDRDASDITKFWFTLPPVTFSNGLRFIITNTRGEQAIREITTSNILFERNKINTIRIKFDQANTVNINKEKERNALLALYNSLGGESWVNSSNWYSDKDVSEWYGVTVDDEGFVTGVDLRNNNLAGELPVEVGDFSKLVTLDLGSDDYDENGNVNENKNSIGGTLPESICRLTSLEYLSLMNNQFEGTLPENLGNLSKMKEMDLSCNGFTGSIPESVWTGMTQLEQLVLSNNMLTGGLSSRMGNATALRELRLDNNAFSATIPDGLCSLTNLEILDLYSAGLLGSIPANIGNLVNLQIFEGHHNKLSGKIPESICNMKELRKLALNANALDGRIPDAIGNLKNLESLFLCNNMLYGSVPSSIGECVNLLYVNVGDNKIDGEIPTSIGNCVKLVEFSAYSNKLGGTLPEELGNCSQLEILSVADNKITGELPVELENLTGLQYISLSDNFITGSVIDFGQMVNLSGLYLANNSELGGSIPAEVLSRISNYSIEGTKINVGSGTGLPEIEIGGENLPWN